ncbi:imidazole glycerol phosphate synthase subunit HisH [Devosia sp. Naph2]|uniref:imidazole glycerol phosphate synthase subunit HisH n=1 Tax=Devosia polycyclovorans TaxID=3345148 RepID=UPI0035D04E2C
MITSRKVTLLDYGMCNMLNVARAFEHAGAELTVTEDPRAALSAERLVVPGVGAFSDSMKEVRTRGHDDAIRRFVETGRPMLGICVGMQILFEGSDEFGQAAGLGIIGGWIKAVPSQSLEGQPQRVPHIGWNQLVQPRETNRGWQDTMLEGTEPDKAAVYFVHSFAAVPANPADRLADFIYGGHHLSAAIKRDNVTATQFHPERSGALGIEMLRRFMDS